ncbi:hypothetical protein BDR07DRAFT_96366 [Suillus spraguei]|nr:hypothetical protein BDR07DRAFT_96366 [Suillus spraguei]
MAEYKVSGDFPAIAISPSVLFSPLKCCLLPRFMQADYLCICTFLMYLWSPVWMWGIQGQIEALLRLFFHLINWPPRFHPSLTPQINWLIGPQLGVAHLQEAYTNVRDKAYPYLVEYGSRTHLPSGPHGCMGLITNILPE